jgi:hypothetical protein
MGPPSKNTGLIILEPPEEKRGIIALKVLQCCLPSGTLKSDHLLNFWWFESKELSINSPVAAASETQMQPMIQHAHT